MLLGQVFSGVSHIFINVLFKTALTMAVCNVTNAQGSSPDAEVPLGSYKALYHLSAHCFGNCQLYCSCFSPTILNNLAAIFSKIVIYYATSTK